MMKMRLMAGAALLALAACSGSERDEEAEALNDMVENVAINESLPAPMPTPVDVNATNAAEAAPPEPPAAPDEAQVQDDADATGMTSRLPATEDEQPANATTE